MSLAGIYVIIIGWYMHQFFSFTTDFPPKSLLNLVHFACIVISVKVDWCLMIQLGSGHSIRYEHRLDPKDSININDC